MGQWRGRGYPRSQSGTLPSSDLRDWPNTAGVGIRADSQGVVCQFEPLPRRPLASRGTPCWKHSGCEGRRACLHCQWVGESGVDCCFAGRFGDFPGRPAFNPGVCSHRLAMGEPCRRNIRMSFRRSKGLVGTPARATLPGHLLRDSKTDRAGRVTGQHPDSNKSIAPSPDGH